MATALARGLVEADCCPATHIRAYDPSADALVRFADAVGAVTCTTSNATAIEHADIVLLAVKPQQLTKVAQEIRSTLTPRQLVVSIAAGVTLGQLSEWFGTERVIRVMPNTPCLVGKGASAYSLGPLATEEDSEEVGAMLSSVGLAVRVSEPMLDCVTGLSGSGPAYVYLMIEALADGGVLVGLPRPTAPQLAAHTVRGRPR